MTPERAQEIIDSTPRDPLGARTEFRKHMSTDDVAEVLKVWDGLPGSTSFADALRYIATGHFVR